MTVRRVKRLPIEDLQPYLLALSDPPTQFDWPAIFGNDHPVELEVGFGKGLFLVNQSTARPDVNFVGIEIVRKYQFFVANRIAKRQRTNVRLACDDGKRVLREGVPAGSLDVIHVYFPDPWWKKRHHKRRLFTSEFVSECLRALRVGGQLSVATDVPAYAEVMKTLLVAEAALKLMPPPEPGSPAHDLDYLTNFERKFRSQGKPIFRFLCERICPAVENQGPEGYNGIG